MNFKRVERRKQQENTLEQEEGKQGEGKKER